MHQFGIWNGSITFVLSDRSTKSPSIIWPFDREMSQSDNADAGMGVAAPSKENKFKSTCPLVRSGFNLPQMSKITRIIQTIAQMTLIIIIPP